MRQVRIASKPMIPMVLRSEHDDLIQEGLIRAYNGRHTYKGATDEDLLKWVLVIVTNHSRDVLDKRSKDPHFEPLPIDSAPAEAEAPAIVASDSTEEQEDAELPQGAATWLKTARAVLGCLSPDDQEILKLRLGMGFSVGKTARVLGISEGATKMRFRRAFQRLIALAKKAKLTPGGPRASAAKHPASSTPDGGEEG